MTFREKIESAIRMNLTVDGKVNAVLGLVESRDNCLRMRRAYRKMVTYPRAAYTVFPFKNHRTLAEVMDTKEPA